LTGGGSPRFAYVEHTAERVSVVDGRVVSERPSDVLDRECWAEANPAYGYRISDESLQSLYDELGPELFARECLCVWDPEAGEDGRLIPQGVWDLVNAPNVELSGRVAFGVDVNEDRSAATIVAVSEAKQIEVVDHHPGVDWVMPRVLELCEKWGTIVAFDAAGPVASLVHEFAPLERQRRLVPVGAEMPRACGSFFDDVAEARLQVKRSKVLDGAVAGAARRFVGDAWKWARRDSSVDITALVAATVGLWAVALPQPKPRIHVLTKEAG
jgi:hypothetical protein